jgi:hypothetical protein
MKIILGSLFVLIAAVLIASAFSWWRYRQYQRELQKTCAFKLWLHVVDEILRQYARKTSERTNQQWRADFDAGLAPAEAVRGVLISLKSEFKVHNPRTSNVVSTTESIFHQ